jgi:hypothetical protein
LDRQTDNWGTVTRAVTVTVTSRIQNHQMIESSNDRIINNTHAVGIGSSTLRDQ